MPGYEIFEQKVLKPYIPAQSDIFHFHDMRHTFASHLVMAGVDLTTVSKLLGHKTLTMTLRYAHLAPAHMVKAVGILMNKLMKRSWLLVYKIYLAR